MRYLALLLTLGLLNQPAQAQDAADPPAEEVPAAETVADQPLKVIETPAANHPAQGLSAALPGCADKRLLELVRRQIAAYQAKQGNSSIYDRRSQKLAVKNMTRFAEIPLDDFVPKDNYRVANRLITLKVNQRLGNQDMRLCRSDNPVLKNQLYLLIYPGDNAVEADILNYGSERTKAADLHFTY